MTIEIKVPSLGESVTEATIAKIHKKQGDSVAAGQLLVELETDKVTLEVDATESGTIASINVKEGDVVSVGQLLTTINPGAAPSVTPAQPTLTASQEKILSPAAGKIAAEKSLDIASIQGSGKDGRVTKGDVLSYSSPAKTFSTEPREERVRMTSLRKKIAERLKESQNTAAILTTFNEIDMSNVMKMRNQYKDLFEKKYGVKLGFMSFFVKAAVAALKEIPAVNAQIDGGDLVYKNYYDIGVAVGSDKGLVVPVVRDADLLHFSDIEKKISEYGKKAREGKISMEELTGGTFTISNGGVYGSLLSTPIINPPQSGILGMHKTMDRPVAIDGKIEIRPMMYVALSYDHRIIDGKEAVTFLVKIKEYIENPERLLFGV